MLNLLPTQSKNNADNADNNLSQYHQAYHCQAIAVVGKEQAEVSVSVATLAKLWDANCKPCIVLGRFKGFGGQTEGKSCRREYTSDKILT